MLNVSWACHRKRLAGPISIHDSEYTHRQSLRSGQPPSPVRPPPGYDYLTGLASAFQHSAAGHGSAARASSLPHSTPGPAPKRDDHLAKPLQTSPIFQKLLHTTESLLHPCPLNIPQARYSACLQITVSCVPEQKYAHQLPEYPDHRPVEPAGCW